MFTVIFAFIFAVIVAVAIGFFAMTVSNSSLVLLGAISMGLTIDQLRANRRQRSA